MALTWWRTSHLGQCGSPPVWLGCDLSPARGPPEQWMMQLAMRLATLLAADALLPSRIQMAFTLAYHILLVPFGVALPFYTLLMEGIGIFRGDPVALKIARRWSVVMAG